MTAGGKGDIFQCFFFFLENKVPRTRRGGNGGRAAAYRHADARAHDRRPHAGARRAGLAPRVSLARWRAQQPHAAAVLEPVEAPAGRQAAEDRAQNSRSRPSAP